MPAVAAQTARSLQRITSNRLLLNVVTGGDQDQQEAYGAFLGHDARYARAAGMPWHRGEGGLGDRLAGGIASLVEEKPVKMVGSFWPYATTLYDYIRRAMPMDALMQVRMPTMRTDLSGIHVRMCPEASSYPYAGYIVGTACGRA